MSDFDAGRQADLAKIDRTLRDPNLPEPIRKKAEEARYFIKHEAGYRTIRRDREKLTEATRAGSKPHVDDLSMKLGRVDGVSRDMV